MAKADPTLVKASMLEAKTRAASNVPNMKPLFDATTEISETYLTQFQNVMKTFKDEQEKQRLALEKQMELFQVAADKAFQSVYELEEPLPDVMIKAFEKEVNNLQDQFEKVNTIGEGDSRENRRARAKIMAELTKLKNNSVNLRKTTTEVLYNISSGSVNTSIVDPASLDPARMVLELGNLDELADQGKVKVTYGKDGAIFTVKDYYSAPEWDYNKTRYNYTDPEGNTGTMSFEEYQALGVKAGKEYVYDEDSETFIKQDNPDGTPDFRALKQEGWKFSPTSEAPSGTKGKMVDWGDEISFTMNDLKETFPPTDPKLDKDIVKLNTESGTKGVFDATGNNPQYDYKQPAQRDAILSIIKDKDDFKDVSQRRIDGLGSIPSFKEALMEDISIPFSVLDKMFYDENGERVEIGQAFKYLDYNEDGKISNEDANFPGVDSEAFKDNIAAMLDAIVNPDNPAFSLSVSKELFADYYVSIDEQTYRTNFEKTVKANNKSNNRNTSSVNKERGSSVYNGYMTFTQQDKIIQDILDGNPVSFKSNEGADTFHRNSDGTWTGKYGGNTISKEELVRDFLYMDYRAKNKFGDDFDFGPVSSSNNNDYSGSTYTYGSQNFGPDGGDKTKDVDLVGMDANTVVDILSATFQLSYNNNITMTVDGDGYIRIDYTDGAPTRFKTTETGIQGFVNTILNSDDWKKNSK
jgi:hypothetical protein